MVVALSHPLFELAAWSGNRNGLKKHKLNLVSLRKTQPEYVLDITLSGGESEEGAALP